MDSAKITSKNAFRGNKMFEATSATMGGRDLIARHMANHRTALIGFKNAAPKPRPPSSAPKRSVTTTKTKLKRHEDFTEVRKVFSTLNRIQSSVPRPQIGQAPPKPRPFTSKATRHIESLHQTELASHQSKLQRIASSKSSIGRGPVLLFSTSQRENSEPFIPAQPKKQIVRLDLAPPAAKGANPSKKPGPGSGLPAGRAAQPPPPPLTKPKVTSVVQDFSAPPLPRASAAHPQNLNEIASETLNINFESIPFESESSAESLALLKERLIDYIVQFRVYRDQDLDELFRLFVKKNVNHPPAQLIEITQTIRHSLDG